MVEPILQVRNLWFQPTNASVTRNAITEIEIVDSYAPDDSVTVVDSWDASKEANGSVMCYVIGTKLIISGNGSGKIYLSNMGMNTFGGYTSGDEYSFINVETLTGLHLLDTSRATSGMSSFFAYMAKVKSLDVSGFTLTQTGYIGSMFLGCRALETVNLSGWDTSAITQFSNLFNGCASLQTVDISNFDCTNATTFALMFGYTGLKKIVFPKEFSLCANVSSMFEESKNLSEIDVSNWDTSKCTKMAFMFYGCTSLKEIDVSKWDVSNVQNFDHFAAHANLKRSGIENWKTTSATNMNALFHNCAEEELDLSGWDVSKNQFFCQMFENSSNLKRIKGLEKWNTSAGLGFDGMFERCSKLEELDLSSFNTTKAKNGTSASDNGHKTATLNNMFLSCNNLKKVTVGPNFAVNGNGSNTTAANKAILPTPSTDYIEGADGNWYTFIGDSFAPNAMKDKTAETYYASPVMVYDADVIVKNSSLIDAAKAIREKNGTTTHYTPAQFGAAIRSL